MKQRLLQVPGTYFWRKKIFLMNTYSLHQHKHTTAHCRRRELMFCYKYTRHMIVTCTSRCALMKMSNWLLPLYSKRDSRDTTIWTIETENDKTFSYNKIYFCIDTTWSNIVQNMMPQTSFFPLLHYYHSTSQIISRFWVECYVLGMFLRAPCSFTLDLVQIWKIFVNGHCLYRSRKYKFIMSYKVQQHLKYTFSHMFT